MLMTPFRKPGLDAARAIYYPNSAVRVEYPEAGAVAFLYPHPANGQPCVTMFAGRKSKPTLRYAYASAERRDSAIKAVLDALICRVGVKKDRAAAARRPHRWEKGLILVASWGYEQTNVDYYELVDVPSPCYVILQEIGAPLARGEEGFMCGKAVPDPTSKIGKPFRRKVNMGNNTGSIVISSCVTACPWDGKERYSSWYG